MASSQHPSTRQASAEMCEKDAVVMHLEDQPYSGISLEDREFLNNFTHEAKARVLKKVIQTNKQHLLTAIKRLY